ncbi:MAG: M23 family metallopeptidase [Anaerolineaceae bacterium]|nr:M23 family metallopeptidase [Anaerolineaceae bacterium]MDE0328235.1 M23 family metallopeptidase [Anaerolineaceae bacterium]
MRRTTMRGGATPLWRRLTGWLLLLGAVLLFLATGALVLTDLLPVDDAAAPVTAEPPTAPVVPGEGRPVRPATTVNLPTLSPAQLDVFLQRSVVPGPPLRDVLLERNVYDPFTVIPERQRNEVIQYTIEKGDTVIGIAERFGLQPNTIAWSNERSIIQSLRPGRVLNIPPVDGVYHTVIGARNIAEIARSYDVDDPWLVIDSEFNQLFGATPETVLPSGTRILIPGGEAEQIAWTPRVQREGGASRSGGSYVSFAVGQPGSCGRVQNATGSFWTNPMSSYTITQGFSIYHSGIDLASVVGAPVRAANGGVVIFSGWNSYGYGYTVVLSHGPFTTVYGHLSRIDVRCRQLVSAGQVVGGLGNSGNSTGPHLHFEIRYLDRPQNPAATIGF